MQSDQNLPVVVIGAGVGGLATAARLAHRGQKVIILEKNDYVGGRNRHHKLGSSIFDGGPTLMMMLEPFQRFFKDLDTKLEDHLDISLCDPSYRVFYRSGDRIDGTPNVAKMLRQIEKMCGDEEASRYPEFLGELGALYHASVPHFVRNNFTQPWTYLMPKHLVLVLKHHMLSNMAKRVHRKFKDERLRMLFTFQTMYLGLSPFDAPWVYGTLTYMEYGDGIYYPQGGLPAISDAIAKLAVEKGTDIRFNSPVKHVVGNQVTLENGEVINAKVVIANADMPYIQKKVEQKAKFKERRLSCSAYVLYMEYRGSLPQLLHHNVYFGRDFQGNLEQIFKKHELPSDPAFYACISKRSEPDRAPEGIENLFILIPCSNLTREFTDEDAKALRKSVFDRLQEEVGFDPANIINMDETNPNDWETQLNLHKGAAFGLSHDLFQSAFFRPKNRSKTNKSLYFVGASTVPGNGIPMVLIGAELVEKRLEQDGIISKR